MLTPIIRKNEYDGPFKGTVFTFTGKLALMDRAEAYGLVKLCGGGCSKNLTKRTTVLVVGSYRDGECFRNKYRMALKYNEQGQNILIIDENTFYQMLFRHFALYSKEIPETVNRSIC